jgi:hypothetical protein
MKVGRFQVMAILQAARAKQLGLSIREAKSWGLNRAIFYAAAKRGFKEKKIPGRNREGISERPMQRGRAMYYLGDEMAYNSKTEGKLYFTIGGTLQTENDFQRQIMDRFGNIYSKAWTEALRIVRQYPRESLLSQNRFFQDIYKPRRDELAAKWTEMAQNE